MAETMHDLLRALHISTGFVGLAAFWIPALARKGGRLHVGAGRVFAACAYVVALSALGSTSWALLHRRAGRGNRCAWARSRRTRSCSSPFSGSLPSCCSAASRPASARCGRATSRTSSPRGACGSSAWPRPQPDWRCSSLVCSTSSRGRRPVLDSGGAGRRHRGRLPRGSPVPRQSPPHADGVVVHAHGRHGRIRHCVNTAFLVFGGQRLWGGALMEGAWSFLPWILPSVVGSRRCTSGRATTSGSSGNCRSRSRRDRRSVRLGQARPTGARGTERGAPAPLPRAPIDRRSRGGPAPGRGPRLHRAFPRSTSPRRVPARPPATGHRLLGRAQSPESC